ncbi:hypothetical protein ACQCSX_04225 [Pseudarthrobacter sp. P1]|uniref:hypothetical protein n=1 Tax=Pseudarthrobacter sp. P1 TaxID=3418418 RepID=UPI003CE993A8
MFCTHCHRPMRPARIRAADAPGTVTLHNQAACAGCHRRNARLAGMGNTPEREASAEARHMHNLRSTAHYITNRRRRGIPRQGTRTA